MILPKTILADLLRQAITSAQAAGDLPPFPMPDTTPGYPKANVKATTNADLDTSLPLKLARVAGQPPLALAETIVRHLPAHDLLAQVEVTPPGFINFTLADAWLARQVETILAEGDHFGCSDIGRGQRVQVEFVSVNPTGPLHIGAARNAAIGDSLAAILTAAGYNVHREYYLNDRGTQMREFYQSLYARYCQALGRDEPMPEQGYRGQYMIDMAQAIAAQEGERFLHLPRQEAITALGQIGFQRVVEQIRTDLEALGVRFDNWFSEDSLHTSGLFAQMMTILAEKGLLVEKDGAVWFAAQGLGEDKDAVLIRSPQVIPDPADRPTYFASDVAYLWNKLVIRGFDRAIYVWGADHHGDVPRMKAVVRALGFAPDRAVFILYQLVTLKRGGQPVRLSKRTGEIITLREVIDEVGPDPIRFFLIARSPDAQMDFDLDLAKSQSEENPVYYVQYAHARIANILRYAQEQLGTTGVNLADGDVRLLTHPAELALIRQMLRLPEVVEEAAQRLAPHPLPHYAQTLAEEFHRFYKQCRVVSADPADAELGKARLKLVAAARIVLANTLRLIGVAAPERM